MAQAQIQDLVSALHQRADLLEQIDDSEIDRREFHREVETSRSTVYRALTDLEEHDLLAQQSSTYQATQFGRLILREYRRFVDVINALCALNASVNSLPAPELFDPIILVDAEIVTATTKSPSRPLQKLRALLLNDKRIRVSTPVCSWELTRILRERMENENRVTVYCDEPSSESRIEQLIAHPQCDQHTLRRQPSFLLAVVGEPASEIGVMIFDDVGRPEAMVRNDTRAALDWANSVLRYCTNNI